MHWDTLKQLQRFIRKYQPKGSVLEVGACDVSNGSVRSLFGDDYTGLDIQPGKGVDIVVDSSRWELGKKFDLVLSCNTLEHVKDPWVLVDTMCQHVEHNGLIYLYAPFSHVYHRHPVDCYRYAPDGLRYLLESSGITVMECYLSRSSNLVPPQYFTSIRTFLQHMHGCWLSAWRLATRRNMPHTSTVAIGTRR